MARLALKFGLLVALATALFGCGSGDSKSGQSVQQDDYAGPPSGAKQTK